MRWIMLAWAWACACVEPTGRGQVRPGLLVDSEQVDTESARAPDSSTPPPPEVFTCDWDTQRVVVWEDITITTDGPPQWGIWTTTEEVAVFQFANANAAGHPQVTCYCIAACSWKEAKIVPIRL